MAEEEEQFEELDQVYAIQPFDYEGVQGLLFLTQGGGPEGGKVFLCL
jgi:hypothetical protein